MANHEAIFRGDTTMKARAERQVVVFGVGALGSNLVDHFARIGFKKIALFDKDRIEGDNVNSQIYNQKEQGQLKVDAMKNRVYLINKTQVETEHRPVTKENIGKFIKKFPENSIFIDCFDNEESRRVLAENIKGCLLHLGVADNYAEIVFNESYRVPSRPPGIDICEYPQARSLSLVAVAIATEMLHVYMTTGKRNNYCFTLNDLKISTY